MEMSSSDVGKSRVYNPNWFKFAVCLGLLLGVLTTILIAVTLAIVIKDSLFRTRQQRLAVVDVFDNIIDSPAVECSSSLNDEDRISCLYKGFFRSQNEQNEYILKLKKGTKLSVNVSSTDNPDVGYYGNASACSPGLTCSVSRTVSWTPIHFNIVYHGCCHSYNYFRAPKYLTDYFDNIRLIAQFNNQKQWVVEEVCTQIANCDVCKCTQLRNYVTLVYVQSNNPGDYAIGLFPLPGCCKCVNS